MKLIQVPPARIEGAYELSPNRAFHFLMPHVAKCWEFACYCVFRIHGPATFPFVLFDCAMQDGHTPTGRHPTGAHDSGLNFDAAYARLRAPFDIGPVSGNRLSGKPTNLDTARQATWFLAMGKAESVFGGKNLIRMIAVDPLAEAPIDAAIARAGGDPDVEREAQRLCFSSPGGGWGTFHFNHAHARFQAVSDANSAELAEYVETAFIAPLLLLPVVPRILEKQPPLGGGPDPLPEAA